MIATKALLRRAPRVGAVLNAARPTSTLVAAKSKPRWHGSGCPCCGPPSGAAAWCSPTTASGSSAAVNRTSRPISFGPTNIGGEAIECDAIVAMGVNDLQLKRVKVAPPAPGEVRMKVVANAICHTDLYTLEGSDPEGLFPAILGHEAGGVVESVGEGVTSVKPGDHVIPCYTPQCKEPDCIFCMSSKTNLCPKIRATQGQGVMPDGTTRFADAVDGTPYHHFMGCSTFCEYTVVPEIAVAKIDPAASLETVCMLGCGVTTGIGAVRNTTAVEPGSSVAVFGLGAIGIAVIQAAKKAGAKRIFAIDVNETKFDLAKAVGATDTLNPNEHDKPMAQVLVGMTQWGIDYTYDCTGNVNVMRSALESAHRGWGVSCVIGVAAAGQEISTRPFQLITGRKWVGTAFGGYKSRDAVPELVKENLEGSLPLDHYVTARFNGLKSIPEAIEGMHTGKVLRAVVSY